MGGAVSSGRDNAELIDNLMGGNYIRSRDVERVFRALDRGDYMTPEARDQAYKDLAWRNGPLHMSAPCIYSEVMEGLELKPGLSFLNVGSGTGYLSTLVGLILGSSGINHGIEINSFVVEYASKKLLQFMEISPTVDEFDFCEPKFLCGNGLCLAPLQAPYDRVYCGAACPEEYQNYFQQLIKVGGILIMPLNDNLLQVKRTGAAEWQTRSLLNVSFASLRVPTKEESAELIRMEEQSPSRLQALARSVIRSRMRGAVRRRHPVVREPPPRAPPAKRSCPRRICIPVDDDDDSDVSLNDLHDLDPASGAHEMNALLSLVLSMGQNRVAGALRVAPLDSESSTDDQDEDERNSPTLHVRHEVQEDSDGSETPGGRNVLMIEYRDGNGVLRNPPIPIRRPRMRRRRRDDWDSGTDRDDRQTDRDNRDSDRGETGGDRDELEEGTNDREINGDELVEDRGELEADRDGRVDRNEKEMVHRETFKDVTEQTDKESNATGDHENTLEAKELDNLLENVEVAPEKEETKSNDTEDMEEISLAAKEVDHKVQEPRLNNKNEKKERKGILRHTLTESQVINLISDRNFTVGDIPVDDFDIVKDSEVDSCKQSTSRQDLDNTTPDTESLDHNETTAQKDSSNLSDSMQNEKESLDDTEAFERKRKKEFVDVSDLSEKEEKLKRSVRKARDARSKARRRSNRSSRHTTDDDEQRNPEVPTEVEICLGKEAGPSTMEWETSEPIDVEAKEPSSGDEATETDMSKVKEEKRHKLDSGIGEENSPSGGSNSQDSAGSEDSDDTEEDEGCDEDVRGRRRRQKRGHLSTRSSSSTDEDSCRSGPRPPRAPRAPRRAPRKDHDLSRRTQLSVLMKRAVKELPLPLALQMYVNLDRSMDF